MKQILEKKELFHHEFSARHRHGEVNEVKTAAALVRWSLINYTDRQVVAVTTGLRFFSPDIEGIAARSRKIVQ